MKEKEEDFIYNLESSLQPDGSEQEVSQEVKVQIECDEQNERVQEYNSCILCGTELIFVHAADYCDGTVTEESSCPSCHIKSKKKSHILQ